MDTRGKATSKRATRVLQKLDTVAINADKTLKRKTTSSQFKVHLSHKPFLTKLTKNRRPFLEVSSRSRKGAENLFDPHPQEEVVAAVLRRYQRSNFR